MHIYIYIYIYIYDKGTYDEQCSIQRGVTITAAGYDAASKLLESTQTPYQACVVRMYVCMAACIYQD